MLIRVVSIVVVFVFVGGGIVILGEGFLLNVIVGQIHPVGKGGEIRLVRDEKRIRRSLDIQAPPIQDANKIGKGATGCCDLCFGGLV